MSVAVRSCLMSRLPAVRGQVETDAPLTGLSWFRTGGNAEVLYRPEDQDDLAAFLAALDPTISITVIGLGANVLIRDGGIAGVVIVLGKGFSAIRIRKTTVSAGAGAVNLTVARACLDREVAGLEFLSGIPGTIGGALRMNAGAYGREISDVILAASALDRSGRLHELNARELGLSYRQCAVPEDWIFVAARLEGEHGSSSRISKQMDTIQDQRRATQPVQTRTGGSTFRNPPGQKAWQLIEAAGCRSLQVGGASVSSLHCNFLVNDGTATAADLENLGEEIRTRVEARTGILLEWEIRRLGIRQTGGAT